MLELTKLSFEDPIDTLFIPVCEDAGIHTNRTVNRLVTKAENLEEFTGKAGEAVVFYSPARQIRRVVLLGVGKKSKLNGESFRAFAGSAVRKAIDMKLEGICFAVPAVRRSLPDSGELIESMMEGACLGNHLFDRYRKEKEQKTIRSIRFMAAGAMVEKYADLPARVETICAGTCLAREWVSMPSNEKRPEQFERLIVSAAENKRLSVTVLKEDDLRERGFGAMLAVSAGSRSEARLVTLDYRPADFTKTVVLVGKGVTFDSGGINLKPSSGLAHMKSDMSGAAAVAAALVSLAQLETRFRVIGVLPLVENMPSGTATRPGDVVTSLAGKTVEIGNTDAEGRLILADAISYAVESFSPDVLIDVATLTGACVVALGDRMAGVFSPFDDIASDLIAAGTYTHERCWRMPLPEDYKELLKSDIADISNMPSTRSGGAITAALFLSEFAGETPWAHVDIAGPAFVTKKTAYCGEGGSGFGVRLLCRYIDRMTDDI